MIYRFLSLFALFVSTSSFCPNGEQFFLEASEAPVRSESESLEVNLSKKLETLDANGMELPSSKCWITAFLAYHKFGAEQKFTNRVITLIDFSLPSTVKRLWVISLSENKILYHTLVAHGRKSGENLATAFSNQAESNMSSLGLYETGELYNGKHGLSLKLDGLESGVNDNARKRAIVMHAADYVSEDLAQSNPRIGRSLGCPAIPPAFTKQIVSRIKNKSCLYIYHPSRTVS